MHTFMSGIQKRRASYFRSKVFDAFFCVVIVDKVSFESSFKKGRLDITQRDYVVNNRENLKQTK